MHRRCNGTHWILMNTVSVFCLSNRLVVMREPFALGCHNNTVAIDTSCLDVDVGVVLFIYKFYLYIESVSVWSVWMRNEKEWVLKEVSLRYADRKELLMYFISIKRTLNWNVCISTALALMDHNSKCHTCWFIMDGDRV